MMPAAGKRPREKKPTSLSKENVCLNYQEQSHPYTGNGHGGFLCFQVAVTAHRAIRCNGLMGRKK